MPGMGRVASLQRSKLPRTVDLIRPTASPLALYPTQPPHAFVRKSPFARHCWGTFRAPFVTEDWSVRIRGS